MVKFKYVLHSESDNVSNYYSLFELLIFIINHRTVSYLLNNNTIIYVKICKQVFVGKYIKGKCVYPFVPV